MQALRTIQHKKEAFWFYRFLSIFYDHYVNPFFWTKEMRAKALELAELNRPDLNTLDAGSGTGFTTQEIAQFVDTNNITCVDQSPHQMGKAKKKADLQGCTFLLGDAENLPFSANHFDRYVSAGSIEYWPDPQRGISEAYRVIKPGGIALVIGPLRPKSWLARTFADIWMLFPEEEEYLKWFREAGFVNLKKRYIAPDWILNEHYAVAISGVKPDGEAVTENNDAPILESKEERMTLKRSFLFLQRMAVGMVAGFIFIPIAIFGKIRLYALRAFGGTSKKTAVEEIQNL